MTVNEVLHSEYEISWRIEVDEKVPLSVTWLKEDKKFVGGYHAPDYIRLPPVGADHHINSSEGKIYLNSQSALWDIYNILLLMTNIDSISKARSLVSTLSIFYAEYPDGQSPFISTD